MSNKNIHFAIGFFGSMFLPVLVYADTERLDKFIVNLNKLILNPLIALLFAVAFVVFLYGVFQFMANSDNDEARSAGKMHMLWGVVGLFVMFSVWGIFGLVLNTLDIKGVDPQKGKVQLNDYEPKFPPN